ncbi:MAG: glycoside hydrolase family 127 protein [Lentisphaeria bacterium]|nr:glycoside hydrolase family 127 protein [Lentisphaeria bacterium]NQZ70923.1 glycoside hydrolase family 127 protein [Lentisphaeria bacterium]
MPVSEINPVFPSRFSFDPDNPFWRDHLKKIICTWIPHCITHSGEPRWLGNFEMAARALQGNKSGTYGDGFWESPEIFGYSDAVVHNTVEAMCWACGIDPAGDSEIKAAQELFHRTIDKWMPIILSAQAEDGFIHTYITVFDPGQREHFGQHYFYCQAYFIEAGIAHYRMTGKTNPIFYNAARRCADNIISDVAAKGENRVYVPHEGISYALFLLSTLVDEEEGAGTAKPYEELSKFLCDNRGSDGGATYSQDHLPVIEQADAVGHAVRAVYLYSGMTDVARKDDDPNYHAAIQKLWDSAVNRRMYLTGGIGAEDEREAFDEDFVLPNQYKPAYAESCASAAMVFWGQRMNLTYGDAAYIDVLELALYNTLLGSVGADGKTHYYRNPLDDTAQREPWIGCCCQGNIARTFASLQNYIYASSEDELIINLYVGSTATIDGIAGTSINVEQKTDYPWDGKIAITLDPEEEKQFTVKLRIPNRNASSCYSYEPQLAHYTSLTVNGEDWQGEIVDGYAAISRNWKSGDRIELLLPMDVQRVRSDSRVEANAGRLALMRGPLVYAFENCDNPELNTLSISGDELTASFDKEFLGGVVKLTGTDITAIPFFARLNREDGHAIVWAKSKND